MNKPHVKQFYKNTKFTSAASVSEVMRIIKQLREQYPQYARKVKIEDISITETYGHEDRTVKVKYSFTDKPNKGIQEITLDKFKLQEIVTKYLS